MKILSKYTINAFLLCLMVSRVWGEFVILDDYMVFDESQNGFMYYWETGEHFPENWPDDWTAPKNYYRGHWVARYEVFSTPLNLCHSYQLCIWQRPENGDAASAAELETCSSPYTFVRGPDIYITETEQLSAWWKKNQGANAPELDRPRDFDRLGIVFRTCDGCYVSPYSVTPNCWSDRDRYLPVDMRITIVAVAEGETFSGWDNYIKGPKLEPPELNPGSTSFYGSVEVEMDTSDAEAEIRYTTDGSIPGPESPLYDGPIKLSGETLVLARTYREGYTSSNITSRRYTNLGVYGTDGLIAHWNFDGDLRDSAGNHDGIAAEGEPEYIEGVHGNALSLGDQLQAVEVPDIVLNPVELTVSAWIKPSAADDAAAKILSKGWGPAAGLPTQDIIFGSYAAFGSQLYFGLNVNNFTETVVASARLWNDQWAHVVGVFDGTSMKVYKDGEFLKETLVTGLITASPDRPFVIGNHSGGSGDQLKWGGGIDDVRMYARALDESEVEKLYQLENASYSFPLGSLWYDAERNEDGTAQAGSLGKVGDAGYPQLTYLQQFGEAISVYSEGAARQSGDGGFFAWRHRTGDWLWIAEDLGGWIYSYNAGWFQVEGTIPQESIWLDAGRTDDQMAMAGPLGTVDDTGYPEFVYISSFQEPVFIRAAGAALDAASGGFFAWRYLSGDWVWTAEDLDGWIYSYRDGWLQL